MSDHKRLGSLLIDRAISTKVSLGFACVLAILGIVSGMAYFAFKSSAEGFALYAQRVAVVGIARDVDRSFLNLRRFVREYAFTNVASNIESARKEEAVLRALIQKGLDEIKNPERHRRLEDISRVVDTYLKDFGQVVTRTQEQEKLIQSGLDPLGLALRQRFETLIAALTTAGDVKATVLANEGLKHFMLARLDVNKLLGRHDAASSALAEKSFGDVDIALRGLDLATKGTAFRQIFDETQAGVAGYRDAFQKASSLEDQINRAVNGTMRDLSQQVQADAEAIKASGIADEQQEEQATLTTIADTAAMILYLSVGGMVSGLVLAWLIGRGIARPVVRMSAAMDALAGGDKLVEIPGLGRGDEIGAMAKAVDVFKRNTLEMDRLRAEQESQKREAQVERKAALRRLADGFEGQVGGVIESVGSATAQLQAASKHMEDNAARTSSEATSVSSASAEAAANAQAVASASEELTASISEIAKQVESARVIASQADEEATQTTELVQKLSQTVSAIGAIGALINDVASQTNLLALNATIEAARAGDAGRGFAVVASEVKNLANQTAKATDEIAGKIGAVQSGTEDAAKAIASITRVMSRMSSISAAIAAAVEQQSAATAEIARNVEQAAAGTQEVSARIANVDVAARETGTTAIEINGSATELSKQAQTLRTEVSRFLEQVRSDQDTTRVIAWDNAWATGSPAIDGHHREFLEGINQLFTHMMNGDGREAVPRIAALIATTIEPHFQEEEELMRRHRYPGLAAHQGAHKAFLARFHGFSRTLDSGETLDAGQFFDFVSDWFRQHMTEFDGPMAKFSRMPQAA